MPWFTFFQSDDNSCHLRESSLSIVCAIEKNSHNIQQVTYAVLNFIHMAKELHERLPELTGIRLKEG